ncbi:beta-glucuronidase [Schleiferilactobacillus shenzhenensis]|uniref:Beta-glucuronidase n=1 Tax=Schleiferilactobacillus shenzhenensis LY-73 TaxID=1231336 RepID=U4TNI0_9LACO|nr:beta-glucuronidase [Schleiferilactobacillus shenzhenensis]ERL64985.1 UidA [Schleiferilactobacillus shenzhenensis LY-73]
MEKEMLYPVINACRTEQKLDGMWQFKFDALGVGGHEHWPAGLPQAQEIPVPASFNDFFTDKDSREYTGDFWYARHFFVPAAAQGRFVGLRFDAVTHRAAIYVNGQLIRRHEGGFLPFVADVTAAVHYGADNLVVVQGNNELSREALPAGDTVTLKNGKKMARPFFDFYNYSGINRSVHLLTLPQQRITDYTVNTTLTGDAAQVAYTVATTVPGTVTVTLTDAAGTVVAQGEGAEGTLTVAQPHLWQVRAAYLYTLTIQLQAAGQLVDEYQDSIGLRTIAIRGHQILVNGQPVYLKGFGRHEDSPFAGRGFDQNVEAKDVALMAWTGANSFRTAHYPYAEEVYQMADRAGFLVIDEVPAVGFKMAAASFLGGLDQSFFGGDWIKPLYTKHLDQITDMIRRDKNHPAVLAWSLLNEPDTCDDRSVPYFKQLFADTAALDPQRRPRTFTLSEDDTITTSKDLQFPDFYLLNRYPGWYHYAGYALSDGEAALRAELDQWASSGIDKPIVFSEFGADTEAGLHKLPSVMWSEEYQVEVLQMFSRVFDSYPFIRGEQVWNFADFQTVEGTMRVNGNKKGIFTRDRQPKAAAFYYRQRWLALPLNFKND